MNEHQIKEDIFNILRLLASSDALTQRDLSAHLSFSLGKTNYLLRSLAKKGLVKIKNFAKGKGNLKKVQYILTQKGFEEKLDLTYHFLKRKEEEYYALKKEAEEAYGKNQIATKTGV